MTAGQLSCAGSARPSPAVRLVPMNNARGAPAVRGVPFAAPAVPRAVAAMVSAVVDSTADARVRAPPDAPFESLLPHALSQTAANNANVAAWRALQAHLTVPGPVMLVASNLQKEYPSGTGTLAVLRNVSFSIPQGSLVAIVGPSGSGKTTLLGLLAGLDVPTRGTVVLDGVDLTRLTEDERARLRGEKVGFIFQTFQLIPTLTALENVQVPLELRGDDGAPERARALLERVGLADRMDHYPAQLSGGEQQRVAIARAF